MLQFAKKPKNHLAGQTRKLLLLTEIQMCTIAIILNWNELRDRPSSYIFFWYQHRKLILSPRKWGAKVKKCIPWAESTSWRSKATETTSKVTDVIKNERSEMTCQQIRSYYADYFCQHCKTLCASVILCARVVMVHVFNFFIYQGAAAPWTPALYGRMPSYCIILF